MSEKYVAVSWNRQKKIYDAVLWSGVAAYLLLFIGLGTTLQPNATIETLLIRGFGTCAILLLHIVLIIGPLCRISPKFLPLLYNRRHLGVTTFVVGAVHGIFAIIQFHALGNFNPFVSILVSNTRYTSLADFPFQVLGLIALVILFLMAVTSHDFWLNNLSASIWKTLHTLVYVAYALLVAHVLLGVLQAETSPILTVLLGLGLSLVIGLHLAAAFKETNLDKEITANGDFVEVCSVEEIPEKRACIRTISGERVAIFKYDGKISAVSNVCQHQNGPLGEGKIGDDGCITCPWHGFQYRPETGASPSPFTEKIPTFNVKIVGGKVFVNRKPNKAGTFVEPAVLSEL
jgi:nitrite reductase/ring-hydroxylating ferredoxin subunit/DMSO/TMAO reductase YedYZ heme-binding membrane subunit